MFIHVKYFVRLFLGKIYTVQIFFKLVSHFLPQLLCDIYTILYFKWFIILICKPNLNK